MKLSQMFFLATVIYVAPHMSAGAALSCGAAALAGAVYFMVKGE